MGRTLRKTYWLIQVFILNVYGSGLLSWDDLCEVVLDIEVSLNHRPLSYVEDDPQFPTLKPSSLLFLNANILPELEPYRLEDRDLRKRAKFLKATKERNYDNSTNGINFTIRKVNLMFVFIVVVWIFFFNKYMIQNPVIFVYLVMLPIVYTFVLWADFYMKLLMSSAKAAVNNFDECNIFKKAAQLSVIVYDNKLNNSNDEAFSINIQSVTVDLDTTNLFILIALVHMVFVFVIVSPAEYQRKEFHVFWREIGEIQEGETFTSNLHQKKHTEVFPNASFYK